MFDKLFPALVKSEVTPNMVDFQVKSYQSETQVIARNYGTSCFIKHDPEARDKDHPTPDEATAWVKEQIESRNKMQAENRAKLKKVRIAKNKALRQEVAKRIADEKKAAKKKTTPNG